MGDLPRFEQFATRVVRGWLQTTSEATELSEKSLQCLVTLITRALTIVSKTDTTG